MFLPDSASVSIAPIGQFAYDYQLVYQYARHFGLNASDAEDSAMDFLCHLLTHNKTHVQPALRRRRAHDFACDAHRSHLRRAQREVLLSDLACPGKPPDVDRPDPCPSPEEVLMRRAFWELLYPVLFALPSDQAWFVLGHYGNGMTVRELAEATGQTVGAVEQALVRALRHLRKSLASAGVRAHDLFDYLPGGK